MRTRRQSVLIVVRETPKRKSIDDYREGFRMLYLDVTAERIQLHSIGLAE